MYYYYYLLHVCILMQPPQKDLSFDIIELSNLHARTTAILRLYSSVSLGRVREVDSLCASTSDTSIDHLDFTNMLIGTVQYTRQEMIAYDIW